MHANQPDKPLPTRDRDGSRCRAREAGEGAAYAAPATLALLSMTEQAMASP